MVARSEGRHVGLPLHRCGVEIKLNHSQLVAVLDTHCHADHVTGAWLMQQATGCRIGISKRYGDAVLWYAVSL